MPKAEKLCTKRGAVLARERREREKKQHEYNGTLKEYLNFKYNHIITEFDTLYTKMKADRPSGMVYTNTKEFRLWQRKYFERQEQVEPPQLNEETETPQLQNEQTEPPPQLLQNEQTEPQLQNEQTEPPPQLLQNEQTEPQLQQDEVARLGNEIVGELEDVIPDYVQEVIIPDPNTDEGIDLDAWEELAGDIREFDYRLEVELGQILE